MFTSSINSTMICRGLGYTYNDLHVFMPLFCMSIQKDNLHADCRPSFVKANQMIMLKHPFMYLMGSKAYSDNVFWAQDRSMYMDYILIPLTILRGYIKEDFYQNSDIQNTRWIS